MDKIVFKDFPDTTTPIDADNLNLLQDNVEDGINGTILYNNTTGTNGTITLNETSANFNYLEIFYKDAYDQFGSVKIYSPNGKNVILNTTYKPSDTIFQIINSTIAISGTSISFGSTNGNLTYNDNSWSVANNNWIYITRIIGYK